MLDPGLSWYATGILQTFGKVFIPGALRTEWWANTISFKVLQQTFGEAPLQETVLNMFSLKGGFKILSPLFFLHSL